MNRIIPELSKEDIKRFWSKVYIKGKDDCWNWLASVDPKNGYGRFCIIIGKNNKITFLPHRIAYFINKNLDPGPYLVCHDCDNVKCCNPKHLFLGTHQDNIIDCIEKGRRIFIKGEQNNLSELTEIQVKEIRYKKENYNISYHKLARDYNVYYNTVWSICNYKTWKHI